MPGGGDRREILPRPDPRRGPRSWRSPTTHLRLTGSTTPTVVTRRPTCWWCHPHDDQVWIGGFAALRKLPAEVDAVVSLRRVGDDDLSAGAQHLDVRLIDAVGQALHADVFRGFRPLVPASDDRVQRCLGFQVGAGGGDLSNRDGHRGVVGPFSRLKRPQVAADHANRLVGTTGRIELVSGAQGVTGGGGQQRPAGPITLCSSQLHGIYLSHGTALAGHGWCRPLRHPSHPRAWGWRAVQSELGDGIS